MKEIRFDTGLLRADQREEVVAWISSLGVKPDDIRAQLVIVKGERSFELHLSRFVRNDAGNMIIDRAFNSVVSEPLVIELGTKETWPSCLNVAQLVGGQR
jgi:hypothetical protein